MRECEELLKIVQRNRDSQLDLAAASRQNDAHVPSMPTAEASHQLLHYRTKVPGSPGRLLAAWTRTQPSREVKLPDTLFGKNWLFTFLLTPLYIYPYTHDLESASRENFERETLEKNKIDSSPIFIKRLFKFLYSLLLHC